MRRTNEAGGRATGLLATLVGAVLLLNVGCNVAPGRMKDLADCGKASVGVGIGLEVYAKVGSLTHPSLGIGSGTFRIGHESRETTGAWSEASAVAPVTTLLGLGFSGGNPSALNWSQLRGRISSDETDDNGFWLPLLMLLDDDNFEDYDPLAFGEITDFEVGGTLVFVSARVGVNPLEIVDFVLGFVGLDIAGDDPKPAKDKADEKDDASHSEAESSGTSEGGPNRKQMEMRQGNRRRGAQSRKPPPSTWLPAAAYGRMPVPDMC